MRIRAKTLAVMLSAMACSAVQSAVIDFESGYGPFTASATDRLNGNQLPSGSGYYKLAGVTGTPMVVYNFSAAPVARFVYSGGASFVLNSFMIAGAWGSQTVSVKGYDNGNELFSDVVAVTTSPVLASLHWSGIDEFRIFIDGNGYSDAGVGGSGQHWALDTLVINESVASIPEPATGLLAVLGLAALGLRLRRK